MPSVLSSHGSLTLTDLYETFERQLNRYALSLTQDPQRADDLVQNTFIRAMAHLGLLENLNQYQRRSWLCRVLKNLFIDEQRSLKREQAFIEGLIREYSSARNAFPDLRAGWVMEKLSERDRELVHQHFILGMTSEEIGSKLGIPPATVRSRIHLAIKRIRSQKI